MKKLIYVLSFFAAIALVACSGGNDGEKSSNNDDANASGTENSSSGANDATTSGNDPKNVAEAMQQAQKAIEESGVGKQAEVINFRELQEFLPEKLAGMERTSKGGQTSGALGMTVSTAEAKYKTNDGASVEINLADTGGLGMGMMSMAAWSSTVIDREDENGSERTSTLDGYKSFERIRNRDESCELSVIAEGRYIVSAKCRKCKMETLKTAVREMDLGDLPKAK